MKKRQSLQKAAENGYNIDVENLSFFWYISIRKNIGIMKGVSAVLRSSGLGISLFINIIIICLWYFLSYVISGHIGSKHTDYRKFPYRIKGFEKRGGFYTDNFAIDSWYRLLPTKYNRIGITPNKLKREDSLTIKEYLGVTCRSELWALINCFYIVCAAILDAPYLAFILGMLVILANLPFIAGSRYCRCLILNELVSKRKELEKQSKLAFETPNVFELDIF